MRRLIFAALAFMVLAVAPARAQLTIEIVGGAGTTVPIAIVPFENESNWPLGISGIVAADLQRSGLFRQVSEAGIVPRPSRAEDVKFGDFRARGADAVVVGSMRPLPDGRVEVRFALLDAVKQTQLAAMTYVVTPPQFRATAHKIADVIYEKLTGDAGVFSTRIAYITRQGGRFELIVADADGSNPQAIVGSNEPLLSPSWSPDGSRIAYVSLENRKPVIYVQSTATGQRQVLANFRGSNSAPAWSPDGRRLAVTLTKDGGSQIFLINADGTGVQRLLTLGRHRHRGLVHAGRQGAAVLLRSRRLAADLPADDRDGRRRTDDVRGRSQCVAAGDTRRQGVRVRAPRRRALHDRDPGLRDATGAIAHAGSARRKPEHRTEFEAHHLRGAAGSAWYIGRSILRRAREAAARLTRSRCARARLGSAAAVTLSNRGDNSCASGSSQLS